MALATDVPVGTPETPPVFGWSVVLALWWAWTWRALLTSVAAGIVLGMVVGVICSAKGISSETYSTPLGIAGLGLGIFFSIWMFKYILNKKHKNFHIVLMPVTPIIPADKATDVFNKVSP